MLCSGSKSANIRTQTGLKCDGKCTFSYSYDAVEIDKVTNEGDYLRVSLANSETYSVKFNSKSYKPTELRIYQPGVHTYNISERADAEVLIEHKSITGTPLYVCTPLTARAGRNKLDSIIALAKDRANSKNGFNVKVNNETTIDIDTLVHNTRFFTYMGTNLDCQGDARYIVYALPTTAAYSTTSQALLNQILCGGSRCKAEATSNKIKVAVNTDGPGNTGGEGNVYIKCRPTGEDDGTISVPVSEGDIYGLDRLKEYSWLFTAFLGAIVMLVLWHAFARLMHGIFGPQSMRSGDGAASAE